MCRVCVRGGCEMIGCSGASRSAGKQRTGRRAHMCGRSMQPQQRRRWREAAARPLSPPLQCACTVNPAPPAPWPCPPPPLVPPAAAPPAPPAPTCMNSSLLPPFIFFTSSGASTSGLKLLPVTWKGKAQEGGRGLGSSQAKTWLGGHGGWRGKSMEPRWPPQPRRAHAPLPPRPARRRRRCRAPPQPLLPSVLPPMRQLVCC